MRRIMNWLAEAPYRLAAAMTVATMVAADEAQAQSNLGGWANNITGNFEGLGKLLLSGAFLTGVGFSGAGLMKLKQAADTQGQQVKYGEGMWRLGVGAGLVALPTATVIMRDSMFSNGNSSLGVMSGVSFRIN